MSRTLMILGLVLATSVLHAADVRAGSAAISTFASFSGPAFSATVVLNPDSVDAGAVPNGTVSIRLTRASTSSAVLFDSGYVSGFLNGCDGIHGATIQSFEGLEAKTNKRFLGTDWLPTAEKAALLAPFGLAPDPIRPLVFSDISDPVCAQVEGVWILSFSGTMQFGKKQPQ
jgi:hypothetical protein